MKRKAESSTQFDLAVVGATPAAVTACLVARQLQLSVLLLAPASESSHPVTPIVWLNQAGVSLLDSLGVSQSDLAAQPFGALNIHTDDLRRTAVVKLDECNGALVDYDAVCSRLIARAVADGAKQLACEITSIGLEDDAVRIGLADGQSFSAAVLCLDDGPVAPICHLARVTSAYEHKSEPLLASATGRCQSGEPSIHVMLSSAGAEPPAVRIHRGEQFQLTVWQRSDERGQRLDALVRTMTDASVVLPGSPALQSRACPAGAALDMHSHVGKRTLLVGETGGFVAEFSADRLHAGLLSGKLAAETVARALAAPLAQDELVTFETAWRTELADYLRMPNTDLSMLLPLVFSENGQMAQRVARAFLLGETL
jgi:flavin-dependent dehydrogenase